MRIQIICKGNVKIGLGHLFRSRTFANQSIKAGHMVEVIAILEDNLWSILKTFDCKVLYSDNDSMVENWVNDYKPEVVVFDSIEFDLDMISRITCQNKHLSVSISPIFNCNHYMDVIFTRAPANNISCSNTKVLSDIKYSIFSSYVRKTSDGAFLRHSNKVQLPVAICMGGVDASNKVYTLLKGLIQLEGECCFWVLLGEGYRHSYDDLVSLANSSSSHEIILAKTSKSMWDVMEQCVVGIFAGGITLLEGVYAGIPSLNIFEKHEHELVTPPIIFKKNAAINCGLVDDVGISNVCSHISKFNSDRTSLLSMRKNCYGLIDKNGSHHILEEIENFLQG